MFRFLRYWLCLMPYALCLAAQAASYQSAPPVISHDGQQIQNVQNYSTSQYWSPNAPYNKRVFPQAVYVQGTELNAGDCSRTVAAQIASYCQVNNKCSGKRLVDVRTAILLALSRMPGHNYATACAGFIDSEFDNYMNTTAISVPQNRAVAFPTGTATSNNNDGGEVQIKNPYEIQVPKWEQEMNERAAELQELQAQNGAGSERLVATDFPKTIADVSFLERVENTRIGLQNPAVQGSAYKKIALNEEEWLNKEKYENAYCSDKGPNGAAAQMAILKSDLAKLQACRAAGTPFKDCKTQGTY